MNDILKNKLLIYDGALKNHFRILNEGSNDTNEAGILTLDEIRNFDEVSRKLKELDWDFEKDVTNYMTHDIHPYTAKFIPQIPRQLILQLSVNGEVVWDPFGGSGTTAVEALFLNRVAVSSDMNPISKIIGKAKTTTLGREETTELFSLLDNIQASYKVKLETLNNNNDSVEQVGRIPGIPHIEKWFGRNPISELSIIRDKIESLSSSSSKNVAMTALSVTVGKVSNQKSETQYSAVEKNIRPGETIKIFSDETHEIINKVNLLKQISPGNKPYFITADIRKPLVELGTIKENSIDLVVSSPPYPNSFDYHLYHRFRLFWLGFNPAEFADGEIGSHLRHQKQRNGFEAYISEMRLALENIYLSLRPGRYAVLVVGDGVYGGQTYHTAEELAVISREIGFKDCEIITRAVHKTKRSINPSARRLEKENILILRKPSTECNFVAHKPNYKLWGYEEVLRKEEVVGLVKSNLIKNEKEIDEISTDFLSIDRLRRLTFTHEIEFGGGQKIQTWQFILENGSPQLKNSFGNRRESKYATHGLHQYKGKFYPQLVKSLLNISGTEPGSIVFDPFCGSGTVPLEGYLNGMISIGCDINPMAVEISKAKIEILTVGLDELQTESENLLKLLNATIKDKVEIISSSSSADLEIERWFPTRVVYKMRCLMTAINQVSNEKIRRFFAMIMSNIIRDISQQDPNDLRIRRRKEEIEDAPVFEMFTKSLTLNINKVETFMRIKHLSPSEYRRFAISEANTCNLNELVEIGLHKGTVDKIITSPPYATALPYIDTDRLSLLVLQKLGTKERSEIESKLVGSREISKKEKRETEDKIMKLDFGQIESEIAKDLIKKVYLSNVGSDVGFRRKNMAALLYKYFNDMATSMKNMDYVLKNGGDIFIVIGDNYTITSNGRVDIETARILHDTGQRIGWELKRAMPITVTTENLNHIKNSIRNNIVLWFRKTL